MTQEKQNKEFDLSKRIKLYNNYNGTRQVRSLLLEEDVKEFISLIEAKVLMDWKGQNEFIDWLKKKVGEKLI